MIRELIQYLDNLIFLYNQERRKKRDELRARYGLPPKVK